MKKILIIEDNDQVQKIYKEALSGQGYQVQQAWSVEEGEKMLTRDKPDLIILDIMFPKGMNGFDLLEKMKKDEKLKNLPVIVLTNLDSEKKVALEIGANDYFVKAYTTLEEVVSKVHKYIGK